MPAVYTFSRSPAETRAELLRVWAGAGRGARELWALQAELRAEPAGWDALWRLGRASCRRLGVRFPCMACVTVTSVDFEELSASVEVLSVPHEAVCLPERAEDVALVELWPTIQQREECVNAAGTAEFIDLLRFYYHNLWMPWDEQDDKVLLPRTIEERMALWCELQDGSIPGPVALEITRLRLDAIDAHERLQELDASLSTTPGADDDDDEALPARYVADSARQWARLEARAARWPLYEGARVRRVLLEDARAQWRRQRAQDNVVALWAGGPAAEFAEVARLLASSVGGAESLAVLAAPAEALARRPARLVLCSARCALPDAALADIDVSSLTGTRLEAAEERAWLLSAAGSCSLRGVALGGAGVGAALAARGGRLHLADCTLLDDGPRAPGERAAGVVAASGARVLLERCELRGLYTGVVAHRGAHVELRECTVSGCGVGVQMYGGATVALHATTVADCGERSVRCELDEASEATDYSEVAGLTVAASCRVGAGDLRREVQLVRHAGAL